MSELRRTVENFMGTARANLTRDGVLTPCLLCVRPEGLDVLPLSGLPKELWPYAPAAFAERFPDYVAICNLNEAWMKTNLDGPVDPKRAVSSYDDRTEVIVIEVKARKGGLEILIQPFDRNALGVP